MQQGYSGSTVQRKGKLVEKVSSDTGFVNSPDRQADLTALSHKLAVLPRIEKIENAAIFMEFVEGQEGLTKENARRAGQALRLLHEQRSYPHPCFTGLHWLIGLANKNLALYNDSRRIAVDVINQYPPDALIHSEPGQFIETQDGSIVFIDFEGIGMGSRYQDLGHMFLEALRREQPGSFNLFLEGYQASPIEVDMRRVKHIAGIISLAYAGFGLAYVGPAEFEQRMQLGLRLLEETGQIMEG